MAVFDAFNSDLDDIAARCGDDDAGVRRVAVLELAEVTDEGAVPLLLEGLRDVDPAVREAAAKALDEHTGAGVAAALEDPVEAVRLTAAETLAEKKDPASAALLIARVDHPEPFVRAATLRAVRELVAPDALPAALRALGDESPEVRREAVSVLGYLKADQALPALTFKGKCYSGLAQMLGTRSITERLAHLLLHLVDTYGVEDQDGVLIGAAFTHADLAHMVGATRQWITISLKRLQDQGVVSCHKSRIVVRRLDALEEMREQDG